MLYTNDRLTSTYEEAIRQTHDLLRSKNSVILDGSFSERRWRRAAVEIAVSSEARFVLVEVRCADQEMLRERLARRRVEPSISDATDEHLPELVRLYEPVDVTDPAPYFSVETDVPPTDVVKTVMHRLWALGVVVT